MQSLLKRGLLLGSALLLGSPAAMAAWTFNNGDVLLGFQATGGQGSGTNIFFNLGSSTALRDGAIQGVLGNLDFDLTQAFGENWYERSDVYFGVIGNLNTGSTNIGQIGYNAPVNGDPSRTVYLSQPTVNPGEGILWTGLSSNNLANAGGAFTGQETMVAGLNPTASGAAVLEQSTAPTAWQNGWTKHNPVGEAAYQVLAGGIQQNFGKGGSATYADVQRILASNTGANPTGTVGSGTYEYTVAIGNDGTISVIPEPSTTLLVGLAGVACAFRRRRNA